jgi:hypothetical protein
MKTFTYITKKAKDFYEVIQVDDEGFEATIALCKSKGWANRITNSLNTPPSEAR